MTTRLETLRSLQTRIREATGPDRDLDFDIGDIIEIPPWEVTPNYTTDPDGLGACVALMREVLPGYGRLVSQNTASSFVEMQHPDGRSRLTGKASHAIETHATLLAIVSALIAIEEQAKETVK